MPLRNTKVGEYTDMIKILNCKKLLRRLKKLFCSIAEIR